MDFSVLHSALSIPVCLVLGWHEIDIDGLKQLHRNRRQLSSTLLSVKVFYRRTSSQQTSRRVPQAPMISASLTLPSTLEASPTFRELQCYNLNPQNRMTDTKAPIALTMPMASGSSLALATLLATAHSNHPPLTLSRIPAPPSFSWTTALSLRTMPRFPARRTIAAKEAIPSPALRHCHRSLWELAATSRLSLVPI